MSACPHVADAEPASVDALARYAQDGQSWVAVDHMDMPIGYVLVDVVDGCAHIEQVSVRPDHQGCGVGRALVERVRTWAADRGLSWRPFDLDQLCLRPDELLLLAVGGE